VQTTCLRSLKALTAVGISSIPPPGTPIKVGSLAVIHSSPFSSVHCCDVLSLLAAPVPKASESPF